MSLSLRRQLLIAVCDSATLQDQLATQLENDLRQESLVANRFDHSNGKTTSAIITSGTSLMTLDRLIFDTEDAHLPRQVAHWVRQTMLSQGRLPQLQVLGIEQMTRQSATIQNQFLRSLERIEDLLPRLNTSLLIWVPWPWLRTIQSSAPTFWKWRSGVFEFVSDPTPTAEVWDDALDPAMFDDDLDAFSDSEVEASAVSLLVDAADQPLSQDDFVSDYVDLNQGPVSLYGEADEGDRPMALPKETIEIAAVEVPSEETPPEKLDAKKLNAEDLDVENLDTESTVEPEPTVKEDRLTTSVVRSSDHDFAHELIKDFVQNSSLPLIVKSPNGVAIDPVIDLVIDPLFEPPAEIRTSQPALQEAASLLPKAPPEEQSEAQSEEQSKEQPEVQSEALLEEWQSEPLESLPVEEDIEERLEETPDESLTPETVIAADVSLVEPAELEAIAPEPTTAAKVSEPNLPTQTIDADTESQKDWNLLNAVSNALRSNLVEAPWLKAAATKWIVKAPTPPDTPEATEKVTEEIAGPEVLELEPEALDADLSGTGSSETTISETATFEAADSGSDVSDSDISEPADPNPHVIRVQVADAESLAFNNFFQSKDLSDDLDFASDLEEDLVVSDAESIGLESLVDAADAPLEIVEVDESEAPEEAPDEIPKETPEEAPKETLEETPKEAQEIEEATDSAVNGRVTSALAAPVVPEEDSTTVAAQQARTQPPNRQDVAADYFSIGYRYRAQIESGERDLGLIELAIAAYEGGLQCITEPHPDWASSLNDLGTLYWLKAQQLSDPQQAWDCMHHSVALYQEALTKIDAQQQPEMVCQLYSNMGAVYSILSTYKDAVDYLQRAVNAYCQALRRCPLSVDPIEYATLNNSLGSVYWKLSHHEEVPQNLQHAIAAYGQALRGYDPNNLPLDYASVQNNIGITYWSLSKHEASVISLKNAIAAYYEALKYRTVAVDPAACAVTYNNLALAYWDLSKNTEIKSESRLRYQKNAITAFEAALNTAEGTQTLSEVDSAAIYHCLGDVHAQMAEAVTSLQEIAQSLRKSLHSYIRAINGLSDDSPIFQARLSAIVANLRSHYEHLGLASQQSALNRIPPNLLPQVMVAL